MAADRTLEAYPADMGACPACDAPYGTVHGPDCVLDPENAPWMRQLLAKLDAVIADSGRLRGLLAAPEGLDARGLYGAWHAARFPDATAEEADIGWDHGSARFHEAWEAVSSRASAVVAAVTAERDRLDAENKSLRAELDRFLERADAAAAADDDLDGDEALVTIRVRVPDHLDADQVAEIGQAAQEWVDDQYPADEGDAEDADLPDDEERE